MVILGTGDSSATQLIQYTTEIAASQRPHHPGQSQHENTHRSCPFEYAGAGIRCGAGCQNVVDQKDGLAFERRCTARLHPESAADIAPPRLGGWHFALARGAADSG